MKLLNKTTLFYFYFVIPTLLLGGILLFFFLQQKITDSLDDSLMLGKSRITELLNNNDPAVPFLYRGDNEVKIDSLSSDSMSTRREDLLTDTMLFSNYEGEMVRYRQLTAYYTSPGHVYRITLRESYVETEDLIQGIVFAILLVFFFLLAGMLLINRWVNHKLWHPFYETLATLDHYDPEQDAMLDFEPTSIKEFKTLNGNLTKMSQRISSSFNEQKQFIENASHEIQTPLAVIRSKTDLLVQSKNIREEESMMIQGIMNASAHLAQLNKALLLLSKIENNQFSSSESVDMQQLIDETLEQYEDMITLKRIIVQKEYQCPLTFDMNRALAGILLNNLFQNAIFHNLPDGRIFISIVPGGMAIGNTGNKLNSSPEELFNRFKKDNAASDTTGLGLAIVRQICNKYFLKVSYHYENDLHVISIKKHLTVIS